MVGGNTFFLWAALASPAPGLSERSLQVPFFEEMPRIDGHLDDRVWARAAPAGDFTQREPHGGEPATHATEVRVFYNRSHLLIGARLTDSEASRIVASEYRRDADLEANDSFEVFLDTFLDRRNAFYFATNAVGAQRDALVRNEGEALNWEWDGIWLVSSSKDAGGWSTEMAIPFSTLRFRPESAEGWGVNFGRLVSRNREDSYWAPIDRDWGFYAKWRVSAFGNMQGIREVRSGGRVILKPFVLGGGERDFVENDGRLDANATAGLDAKIGVSATLVADLTANTDFAQVESDQEQVNLTRFPLFFPEKREFFLENAGLFQIGERIQPFEPPSTLLFFSRQIGLSEEGEIVPLAGGGRLTGKLGRFDIGLLDIVAKETVLEDGTLLPRANFAALRLKRDVFSRSSVGGFYLVKAPASEAESNQVAGADVSFAFKEKARITGFAAESFGPGTTGASHALHVNTSWEGDRFGAMASYLDIGEDFNDELGFIPRVGVRKYRGNFYWGRRPDRGVIRQWFLGGDHTYIANRDGSLQSQANALGPALIFNNGSFVFLGWLNLAEGLTEPFEIRDGVEVPVGRYRFNQATAQYFADRSRALSVGGGFTAGSFYHGNLFSFNVTGRFRPQNRVAIEVEYYRNRVELPVPGGDFSTNLVITRAAFSFSPRAFVRGLFQINDDAREARAQVVFRYTYRPGADLFVVYNEVRGIRGEEPPLKKRELLAKLTLYAAPW